MAKTYLCDAARNGPCKKTFCGYLGLGECFSTTDPSYARRGLLGFPMRNWKQDIRWFCSRNKVTYEIGHCFYCLKRQLLKR